MSAISASPLELQGSRVTLRPLLPDDFEQWSGVRLRNEDWLTPWEPRPIAGRPDVVRDPRAFAARCGARNREIQLGTGFGFGIFVGGGFAGEINMSSVQRGPLQNADVGYWIDESLAGQGYMPEAVVVICRFAFEDLALHRLQISIIPRNMRSRRVMEKLDVRDEGIALRLVEINGAWEDHIRFAMTFEEWAERRNDLVGNWLAAG
jgi:ribosomal-protein-alanine N-acetyltransferase